MHPYFKNSGLKNLGIDFPVLVAPMVGLSHVAFRELIRHYIPEGLNVLIFTEMLSSRRIPSERLDHAHSLKCSENESYFVPQLLANEERFIKPSIDKLSTLNPWGFDINMGCPVKKTLRHNWGVRLMGDPDYAAKVVSMARKCSDRPLSVKMRGGHGDEVSVQTLVDFTAKIEEAGADWITIHPRPKEKKHKGRANWRAIAEVKKHRRIPVVANGDVQSCDDMQKLFLDYGVDGVMIARAMTARPWLIWQFAESLGYELKPSSFPDQAAPQGEQEGPEYLRALLYYADLLDKYFAGEAYKMHSLRFFVATGSKWFLFGHAFWRYMLKGKSFAELRDRIAAYAETHQHPMIKRVEH